MGLLLTYLFIALITSFLCSLMEATILSISKSYILAKINENKKWATLFLKHKSEIDKPLSAILSLNTIAHTIGAAGVGAQVTALWGDAYFGISSAILTILILVITEIFPKTIGTMYATSLAPFAGYTIQVMIVISYPLVYMSSKITSLISRKTAENTISREELSILANIGNNEGLFNETEHKIIQNILLLKNIKVTDIMTPRVVLSTANENKTVQEFIDQKKKYTFSRIPIYSENPENITGYVFRPSIFESSSNNEHAMLLKDLKRKIVIISETKSALHAWETLLQEKEHIALIVDEYGGVDGIVTMEDIIETIVGFEIVDEKDTVRDMQHYAREKWKMRQAKFNIIDTSETIKSDIS